MNKQYTEAAPTQKVTLDEDEALTLAERTISTGINEKLRTTDAMRAFMEDYEKIKRVSRYAI